MLLRVFSGDETPVNDLGDEGTPRLQKGAFEDQKSGSNEHFLPFDRRIPFQTTQSFWLNIKLSGVL